MTITSFVLVGPFSVEARPVTIRCAVNASKKPASFHVMDGVSSLPVAQVKEISARVRSAISASGICAWPTGRVEITLNAGGAKVQAATLDLPIALAIAGIDTDGLLVAGELGLDGSVRAVRGVLQASLLAKALGLRGVLVPGQNAREALAAADGNLAVHAVSHLADVAQAIATKAEPAKAASKAAPSGVDFADVRGQAEAVAKVEQAVKARAGLFLSGAPGTGKTMIARRIPGVLPKMGRDEQLEVTCVYSAVGLADGLVSDRPFRAPHHTISAAALVGGGASRRPGEVQLATRGVLFLDEVQEFARGAIEALSEAIGRMPVASRPLVVASANPCPCGWRGSATRACTCSDDAVARYAARAEWAATKLGLTITAAVQLIGDLRSAAVGESSASIASRIGAS
jgi:magnesium chelatase family protein